MGPDSLSKKIEYFSKDGSLIYFAFYSQGWGGGTIFFVGNSYFHGGKYFKVNTYSHCDTSPGKKHDSYTRGLMPSEFLMWRYLVKRRIHEFKYKKPFPLYHINLKSLQQSSSIASTSQSVELLMYLINAFAFSNTIVNYLF